VCNDVVPKKKLDAHRGKCRGASFTCLDCMVHFQGTDYRAHTSCVTEAQKYQGALYKDKSSKQPRPKTVEQSNGKHHANGNGNKHRRPYVEDAPDADDPNPKEPPPPPAPSPPPVSSSSAPPCTQAESSGIKADVNVFDFLLPDETPNASKVSLVGSREQMKMVDHAPSVFEPSKALARLDAELDDEEKEYDIAYEENGFSYGADPIKPSLYPNFESNVSMEFMTPAPRNGKDRNNRNRDRQASADSSQANGANGAGDKKRKRGHIEDLDIAAANLRPEADTPMAEAPSSMQNVLAAGRKKPRSVTMDWEFPSKAVQGASCPCLEAPRCQAVAAAPAIHHQKLLSKSTVALPTLTRILVRWFRSAGTKEPPVCGIR
jgi:cell growth-regulating nucleolar protein